MELWFFFLVVVLIFLVFFFLVWGSLCVMLVFFFFFSIGFLLGRCGLIYLVWMVLVFFLFCFVNVVFVGLFCLIWWEYLCDVVDIVVFLCWWWWVWKEVLDIFVWRILLFFYLCCVLWGWYFLVGDCLLVCVGFWLLVCMKSCLCVLNDCGCVGLWGLFGNN